MQLGADGARRTHKGTRRNDRQPEHVVRDSVCLGAADFARHYDGDGRLMDVQENMVDEQLRSLSATASQIQLLVLQMSMSRRISVDRRMDIIRAGERIAELGRKLGKDEA